jgi:glutamyl-tRNA(Gln) amidotransferase subunit D
MRASVAAAEADLSGVFVCMHENLSDDACLLHFGAKVRKMHTTRRDAFHSINTLPAARIFSANDKIEKLSPLAQSRNTAKLSLDTKLNENVALVYVHPGISPKFISSLSSFDGIVLAGTGMGHLPLNIRGDPLGKPIYSEVRALIDSGIPVAMCSQAIYGRVDMDVYANGRAQREMGVIGHLADMTPECAYVKLMWVLAREKRMERVRDLMERNLVGEISARTEITEY